MNDNSYYDVAIDKLKGFGYPSELCDVVFRFSKYVYDKFSDMTPGVLLIGSTARGELSWADNSEGVHLFSDIEFLVAVSKNNKNKEDEFRNLILKLETEYDFGDLFHIDYTIITWSKLPKLEKKFFIYESKQCGINFGEKSVSSQLPIVNRSNIKWKELNEVLLHRLTSMLHAIPVTFLTSTMTIEEKRTIGLNIAKNTLDITTWLHPYEADNLVAGFTMRLASWDKAFLERKKLGEFISSEDIDYMNRCLALRNSPYSDVDVMGMLQKTLSLYSKAILYCKAMNDMDKKTNISDVVPSIKLFDEYSLRQRVSQASSMFKNISEVGLSKFVRNSVCIRKGIAVNICNFLLLAANDCIKEDAASIKHLNMARSEFSKLTKLEVIQEENFVKAWIDLRECFKQYQNITHNY